MVSLSKLSGEKDARTIGVDVGGTNLRVGVVGADGVVHEQRVQADFKAFCRSHSADAALDFILDTLCSAIDGARARHPEVQAVGIGFPGFIDPKTQRVTQSPNLPGLLQVDLTTPLQKLLGLPVVLENDALAAGYGEYLVSGGEHASMIYMGLGTGVGGSVILDGRAYAGSHGVSMEIGHLIVEPGGRPCGCGNRGCLEQYASASGIALTYAELAGRSDRDSGQISALAHEGDAHAREAFRRGGEVLAQGLASILKVLDVPLVIIGGGASQSWHLMQQAFDQRLEQDLIPALRGKVTVKTSSTHDQAGIIGAALLGYAHAHGKRDQN